jgi:hypothetical protein
MRVLVLLLLLAEGCADSGIVDDLAGEDGDGTDDGKADDSGAFTYYKVTGTTNLSIAQLNKSATTCPDGQSRASCRIDRVDYKGTGLAAEEVDAAIAGKPVIVRGTLTGDVVNATELWVGATGGAPRGVFVKLRDATVTCTALRCETREEIKLNSTLRSRAADLDFGAASEVDAANAQAAIGQSGLIIAGERTESRGLKGRTVTASFVRVAGRKQWNVNDVSILFPLPAEGEQTQLLGMVNGANTLLPEAAFRILGNQSSGIPFLIEGPGRDQLYPKLRVTSVRIDPCFDETNPATAVRCVRQVRLVAQPYDLGGFMDASVHLFYTLDDAAFVDLLVKVRAVGLGGTGPAALGVHPKLASEGLRGPTATALKAALLDACTLQRLTKFTVMATGRSKNWFFHTLVPDANGMFQPVHGDNNEGAFSDHGSPALRDPAPLGDPVFPDELLSTASVQSLSETQLIAGIDKLERISNPKLAKTSETRCASCHATGTTLDYILALEEVALVPRTPSSFSPLAFVAASSRHGFSNHHAFSYMNEQPTVNRRVVNDTIATVQYLRSEAFLKSLAPDLRARIE